jgi:hypothetical protein
MTELGVILSDDLLTAEKITVHRSPNAFEEPSHVSAAN